MKPSRDPWFLALRGVFRVVIRLRRRRRAGDRARSTPAEPVGRGPIE